MADSDLAGVAIVLPGARYTPARPLLHFVGRVLTGKGWTVREVWWSPPESLDEPVDWVRQQLEAEIAREQNQAGLIVGKSIGTLALPVAAERQIPGIWLTPLVHERAVLEALERQQAPTLLIAGGADPSWSPEAVPERHRTVVLEDANHGLEVDGDVHGSLRHLGIIADEVARFVDRLG